MKKKFLIFSGFFFLLGSCKNPFGKSSITSLKSSDSPTKDVSPSLNQERPKSDGFRKTEEIRFDTITIDYPFSEEKEDTDRLKTTCSYTSFPDARIITSKESFLSLSDTYPDFRTERKDLSFPTGTLPLATFFSFHGNPSFTNIPGKYSL